EINEAYHGRIEEVLIEAHQVTNGEHQWRGRTRTNKLVFFPATRPSAGEGAASSAEASPGASSGRLQGNRATAVMSPPHTDVRPGALVHVLIEKTTPWSLQGRLATR